MVYGVIQNFIQGLKYRGGWRGLLEHMYTVRTMRWLFLLFSLSASLVCLRAFVCVCVM
jgi:hypothetical protein